ncbi:hypothetical protein OSB04_026432 [Centaurea solstitialis]|uniref:JAB1/MPN/MOV34 metalloenzyme domain-containing protein n=1 Tax=Centaurea solstitialis TaxID=347529 RepID=A0AA38SQ40_9ASTR|nr:hypothetical protein OSB04_026432 [Centaurea solstitialis]
MASVDQALLLLFSLSSSLSTKVHLLVIFNICDCFVRRPDQAERVIGTLLGSILPDDDPNDNSYVVPYGESLDQVFGVTVAREELLLLMCYSATSLISWFLFVLVCVFDPDIML